MFLYIPSTVYRILFIRYLCIRLCLLNLSLILHPCIDSLYLYYWYSISPLIVYYITVSVILLQYYWCCMWLVDISYRMVRYIQHHRISDTIRWLLIYNQTNNGIVYYCWCHTTPVVITYYNTVIYIELGRIWYGLWWL